MRTLVTGATGFVGQALCLHLERRGHAVRRMVRRPAAGLPGDSVVVGDIGPQTDWTRALDGVEVVVHLAARVHAPRTQASEYQAVNNLGTSRLANAAASVGVRRLVLLSSVKVNGETTRRPFSEADPPGPQDDYARSKWDAEQALARIGAQTGLECVVLRPPLVYGPRVRANFLRLLEAVHRRRPLPLGAVENRRSLLFVGNLADAIERCVAAPDAAGQTFLLSDGEDVSTPELVRRLARALGVEARLLRVPPGVLRVAGLLAGRRSAVDRLLGSLQVDSSHLRHRLRWTPPFTLDAGLAETARWYLDRIA